MASFFDLLSLTPKSKIGAVEIQASLEEVLTDTLELTEHPIEQGASVTDHSYKKPSEVVITCGWNNSSIDGLLATSKNIVASFFSGGATSAADYIAGVYSQLLSLQESRIPFDITTSKRQYTNMLITGLQATTDQKTAQVLMVQATCKQIIIVQTQTTTMPPASAQANPAKTGAISNTGVSLPIPALPAPGGSVIPQLW